MPLKNITRGQKIFILDSELGVKAFIWELTAANQKVSNPVFSVSSCYTSVKLKIQINFVWKINILNPFIYSLRDKKILDLGRDTTVCRGASLSSLPAAVVVHPELLVELEVRQRRRR